MLQMKNICEPLLGELDGREHLENLGVDDCIVLK
jgi:hypothetical protein